MLKVYAAYSAIIVQIFYAFVFYVVSSCCDDPLFGPVAFKNGSDGVVITLAGSRLRIKNLGHNFG